MSKGREAWEKLVRLEKALKEVELYKNTMEPEAYETVIKALEEKIYLDKIYNY